MSADSKDVQLPADHVKFRGPEGLFKPPFRIERKNKMLFDAVAEQTVYVISLSDIYADVVQVVIG